MKRCFIVFMFTVSHVTSCYIQSQVVALQKAIANNSYINVCRCDFRGANLSDLNLSNAQISGANFGEPKKKSTVSGVISIPGQKTNLSKVDFTGSQLVSTNFQGALLMNANFAGADIAGADFSGADLTNANFNGVLNGQQAVFCGATMPDGTIYNGTSWTSKSGEKLLCHCPTKKNS